MIIEMQIIHIKLMYLASLLKKKKSESVTGLAAMIVCGELAGVGGTGELEVEIM